MKLYSPVSVSFAYEGLHGQVSNNTYATSNWTFTIMHADKLFTCYDML